MRISSRCLCSTPSVLHSKTLPQAEFTSAEDRNPARGPRKMLRHFVGSAKAAGRIAYCPGGPAGGGVSSSTQTKIKRWPQGHLFLQRWGSGSPRPRSALAMTGFFSRVAVQFRAARCGYPALRRTRSTVGRDDVGIVPYETMTRNVAHNTADAKCFPAASGQRGPA